MKNSADLDQLASEKPTDLDLHCLQRQGRPWLNLPYNLFGFLTGDKDTTTFALSEQTSLSKQCRQ